jgi:hypothetical protein
MNFAPISCLGITLYMWENALCVLVNLGSEEDVL